MSRPQKRGVKREPGDAREGEQPNETQPRRKQSVRRKVNMACIYCRRSHMTCDESRPCRRCVKRDIGHLCRDEAASPSPSAAARSRVQRTHPHPQYGDMTAIRPQATLQMAPRPELLHDLGGQGIMLDPAQAHIQPHTHTSAFAPTDPMASLTMPTLTNSESPTQLTMSSSFASTSSQDIGLLPPSQANPDVALAQQPLTTAPDINIPPVTPSVAQRGDASDSSLFHGTPLGGAGWLGLGGSAQQSVTTGDSGGGGEFNTLSEFLESLDDSSWYLHKNAQEPSANSSSNQLSFPYEHGIGKHARDPLSSDPGVSLVSPRGRLEDSQSTPYPPLLAGSKTERFLLTAADQTDGSRDERLRKVIQAKYEAGLLRPYNHVNGYARLNRWMEQNVSASSRRRILKPLSVFRPVFYSVAKNLTQFDLIYIEEAFERLLLDYDRVFSIQGVPACLWRRTGEIYKGNKEFAELVGVPIEALREGRLCIYELMAEESAVNYWEKYGAVSFDPSQKAVLTMCKLRSKNRSLLRAHTEAKERGEHTEPQGEQQKEGDAESDTPSKLVESNDPQTSREPSDAPSGPDATARDAATPSPENKSVPASLHARADARAPTYIPCCFSFTIRRDKWNVRASLTSDPYYDRWSTCVPVQLTYRTFCRQIQRNQ